MKLWRIKANALRIMFSDSDMEFSEEEFTNDTLMDNGNTREKLIGMDESIRRGIDLYYQINGTITKKTNLTLRVEDEVYLNEVDISGIEDFYYPNRIDVKIYDDGSIISKRDSVPFRFDKEEGVVTLIDNNDYAEYKADVTVVVYYKKIEENMPYDIDSTYYDLDDIGIPEKVQRNLPYFVKGELYEEDEYLMAQQSMSTYINFLHRINKDFSRKQTHVISANVFKKRN